MNNRRGAIAVCFATLGLLTLACAPLPPTPALPGAGCYAASVPGASGSIYFTGVAPTPWNPHNIKAYVSDPDCSPAALTGDYSGVSASNELDAFVKCNEQTGKPTYPPNVTAATYWGLGPAFANVWMCFPI